MLKKKILNITLAMVVFAAVGNAGSALAIEENTIITVSRIAIDIDRPADVVWPYVIDFSKWSSAQIERLNGQPGEVGSTVRTTIPSGEFKQVRTEEVLLSDPNRRLVLRVHPEPNPTNMTVTVNIELLPRGDKGTTFQLDVYMKTEAPGDAPLPREQLLQQQTEIGNGMNASLLPPYTRLKTAVEENTTP